MKTPPKVRWSDEIERAVVESATSKDARLLPGEYSFYRTDKLPCGYEVFKGHVRLGWVYRHGCGRAVWMDDSTPMTAEGLDCVMQIVRLCEAIVAEADKEANNAQQ